MLKNYFKRQRVFAASLAVSLGLAVGFPALAENWTLQGNNIYNNNPGNVAIGTSTAPRLLTVSGSGPNNGTMYIQNTSPIGWSAFSVLDSSGTEKFGFGYGNSGVGTYRGQAYFNAYTDTVFGVQTPNFIRFDTNNIERMRISSTGNVGIGNSFPTRLLTVTGSGPNNGTMYIQNTSPIGWSAFSVLDSSGTEKFGFGYGNSGVSVYKGQAYFNAYTDTVFGVQTPNYMRFDTNNIERMRITSSGNVGIGTSSPTQALEVIGNIKLSGSVVSDGDICIGTCQ